MHAQPHAPGTWPTLRALVPDSLAVGAPSTAGTLTIFPLLAPDGRAGYRALADALEAGGRLRELPQPDVNRLLFDAPVGPSVLLYAGEEVAGAKQNRVINATLLLAGGSSGPVPVSCIEAGRWTPGAEEAGRFSVTSQVAYTGLRRKMGTMVTSSRRTGRGHTTDQSEVWAEVATRSADLGHQSRTDAMTSIYESRSASLEELVQQAPPVEGQVGMIAFLGERLAAVDLVSSRAVWSRVHARLLRGHALEALSGTHRGSATREGAERALDALLDAPLEVAPAELGLGADVRVRVDLADLHLAATGLAFEGELVQLSAFAEA
jgi:hypothetical protein